MDKHGVAVASASTALAIPILTTCICQRYFGCSQNQATQQAPAYHKPYAKLQARSLLDNHDLTLVGCHLCALRFVLPNFHMERNMPIFRIEMAKIESTVDYIAKRAVKHVALAMKEAIDMTLNAETSQEKVGKDFQKEIRKCRAWATQMIKTTREVLDDYKKVLAFIIQEAHPYSAEDHKQVSIYDLMRGQRRHDPVNVRRVMDLGWKGYLVSSGELLLKGRRVMLQILDRLCRFLHALYNMSPRNFQEAQHPNYPDWERQDRAILCRSIEIVESENDLIWILATEDIGGRGEEPGPRYLSWYNDLDVMVAFANVLNNENAMGEAAVASLDGSRDRNGKAIHGQVARQAGVTKKRQLEGKDESHAEQNGVNNGEGEGESEEEEEEQEAKARGTKRQRFTTYYSEERAIP